MDIINSIKQYLKETCNYTFIGLKYIYFEPEKCMYVIFIKFENNKFDINILNKSNKIESCFLIDYIIDMYYFNPLLINYTKNFQRILLKNKKTKKNINNIYLDFKYGKLITTFEKFGGKFWNNKIKQDKNKYFNKLTIDQKEIIYKGLV